MTIVDDKRGQRSGVQPQAIVGRLRRMDATKGDLRHSTATLGLFFTIELALHSIVGIAATLLIARLGAVHLSAVTLSLAIVSIAVSIFGDIGTGVSAIVAQCSGSGNRADAALAVGQAIVLSAAFSLPIGVGGALAAANLLLAMGADMEVASLGTVYLQLWLAAVFVLEIPFVLGAALRALGDTAVVTFVQFQELVTQLVLMPVLIFGIGPVPRLGVAGQILALLCARMLSIVIQVGALRKHRLDVPLSLASLRPHLPMMRRILSLAVPATGQQLARYGADALIVRLVAGYGVSAIAGFAISQRLLQVLETAARGIGNAALTIVGQNLGAGQGRRARRGARIALFYGVSVTAIGVVVLVAFAPTLVAVFTTEWAVIRLGTQALQVLALSFVFTAVALVLTRVFHAAGDMISPLTIDLMALWVVQFALAAILHASGWSVFGVWIAITAAQVVRSVALGIWLRGNRRLRLAFSAS